MAQQGQAGTTEAGTDPAYVPDRDVFEAYTHQQIWDLVRVALAPAELSRLADLWGDTATAVESAFDEFARDIARLSGSWSGLSATAAARAATAYVRSGDDAVTVCRVVEQLLSADSTAAESVRAAIPPPPGPYLPDPDPAVEAATGAPRRTAYNTAAAALTAAAQDAMTFGYNPTIAASGDNVPRFPAPMGEDPPGDRPTSGAPIPPAPAAPPATDRVRTPVGPATEPPPLAGPPSVPQAEPSASDGGARAADTGSRIDRPGITPDERNTRSAADEPRPHTDTPTAELDPGPSRNRSDIDDADPGSDATTAPSASDSDSAVARPAAESAAGIDTPRAQPATAAGAPTVADRSDTVATRAAAPHRATPPIGWSAASAAGGSDTAGGSPAQTAPVGGNRPGPADSFTSAAVHSHTSTPGSDPGAARPGHSEQIARSVGLRATTEAARESSGINSTEPEATEAGDRSEQHPGARTTRATGLPLPTATRPSPPREAERERTGPDYLRAPNEQLTATSPATPPVFGEYTDEEKTDRPGPGGGSR